MGRTALVVGSAGPVWDEVGAALDMFTPDEVICINHAIVEYPGEVAHHCSFHCENFMYWLNKRVAAGRSVPEWIWTSKGRKVPDNVLEEHPGKLRFAPNWGGSSGLLAVAVAIELRCQSIILCGVHLDTTAHYHDPNALPWKHALMYRKAWRINFDLLSGRIRSMGGWTRDMFGAPTHEWINRRPDPTSIPKTNDRARSPRNTDRRAGESAKTRIS